MVQVDISQLIGECNTWREALRKYREEFTQDENKLRQVAGQPLSKEQLHDVEHLHNQFHIQLINIHDLKQGIKNHERIISFETQANKGLMSEETIAKHENLLDQYQRLEQKLLELRTEFNEFLDRT
jgi:hypothetical protein